jgi:hypothetical protein
MIADLVAGVLPKHCQDLPVALLPEPSRHSLAVTEFR